MLKVDSLNDKKDFDNVRNAMKVLGLQTQEIETIWKLVAAILHLVSLLALLSLSLSLCLSLSLFLSLSLISLLQGNLQFRDEDSKDVEGAAVTSPDLVSTIAQLLAVPPQQLEEALCSRVIASKREVVTKRHSADQAYYSRNAFAKVGVYCI